MFKIFLFEPAARNTWLIGSTVLTYFNDHSELFKFGPGMQNNTCPGENAISLEPKLPPSSLPLQISRTRKIFYQGQDDCLRKKEVHMK